MSDHREFEDLLRELAPQVLGVIMRRFGGLDAAEDAVQEALITAATHWPADGVPGNPRGWLLQVATRRMIDQIRSDQARRHREVVAATAEPPPPDLGPGADLGTGAGADLSGFSGRVAGAGIAAMTGGAADRDDTLVLLFMCCHPVLTPASAIALTLRAVGGLTTAEIASAFLVPEATMAQRISRAKQRIKASAVPFGMPGEQDRSERLRSVLHVLYLIFNEGYAASAGARLHRAELSGEAIRLTRTVHALLPGDGQVTGLLALMLLTEARRQARTGPAGELVPLAEQDRGRWNHGLIEEGVALAVRAMSQGPAGDYQLQAAIAALHDEAARAQDTDWRQILALYGLLEKLTGNPMVSLSRAVAAAMVHGPAAGLDLLGPLDERLAGHYRLDAVRAHLFDMLGDTEAAAAHYQAAARGTLSIPERNYLITKAAGLNRRQAERHTEH
jgi:RNA polymerase sigma factor (sigma-70 family)